MSKSNILKAFVNIVGDSEKSIRPALVSNNRINNVGDALENYIKDAVVGLLGKAVSIDERNRIYGDNFSWLGNKSNPPDCLIKNGDAIEVKKIESLNSAIALNSSYPKNKLYSTDKRVARGAKIAEDWDEKDIVYAIGTVKDFVLHRLWLIYGDCYAASKTVYEKFDNLIKNGVSTIPDLEFQETNELGRLNKVDPLGITNMRIRGMWHIANPSKLYPNFVSNSQNKQIYLLLKESKYKSFPKEDRRLVERINKKGFSNSLVKIQNPDNPAKLIRARIFKYEI